MQKIFSKLVLLRKIFNFIKLMMFWDFYLDWAFSILPHILRIIKQEHIDIIFSSSPSYASISIASKIKKSIPHIKWVMDIRDPWVESMYHRYNKFQLQFIKKIEKSAFINADYVTVVSKYMKILYESKYHKDNIRVIYNGFNSQFNVSKKIELKGFDKNSFSIVYTGLLYSGREKVFIEFLNLIKEIMFNSSESFKNIKVYFAGYANQNSIRYFNKNYDTFFRYVGKLSIIESIELQNKSSILLLITDDVSEFPSKLFEYINADKMILYLSSNIIPEIKNILDSTKTGVSFNIKQSQEIKDFIKEYYSGKIEFEPYKVKIEKFNIEFQLKKLVETINE